FTLVRPKCMSLARVHPGRLARFDKSIDSTVVRPSPRPPPNIVTRLLGGLAVVSMESTAAPSWRSGNCCNPSSLQVPDEAPVSLMNPVGAEAFCCQPAPELKISPVGSKCSDG